jgi:hypothetical protein
VRAVDLALRELEREAAEPEPVAQPAPPAAPPVPPAAQPAPPAAPPAPPVVQAVPEATFIELRISGIAQRWSEHAAAGAEVAPSFGTMGLRYGVVLGAAWALAEPSSFDVNEWHVAAELGWQPRWAGGVRAQLSAGGSLLLATPRARLSVESQTSVGAAILQASLSRPIWLGGLGISPELGVSASSATRRVRIDEIERLILPVFAPQAKLSLLWRAP